ncbi:putative mannan endo-1,4-beta-mannosidase [Helianthus annuus]|nr:putative mannan endo-1,4-beta-mannosidase [Helianthus annuus]KAJ0696540.1 putative mannan endo-1,4-beta-mannosidase [Helianthus annuus]KAJ0742764.1 putative mannan endo-1,4-beta-mannosidase [Helianthus annuus]
MALARAATTHGLSSKGVTSDWIEEMSSFVKSIDRKHMLTIGLEGRVLRP